MARSNQTPATEQPVEDTVEDAVVAEVPAEEVAADIAPADQPAAAEDAVVVAPVDHWWVAAEDFTVTVDWTTVAAKAGVSRFDPATGARLVALGVPLTPIES